MHEQTLVLIKPDAIERGLIGEIIARYERRGLKILQMKLLEPSEELIRAHYAEHAGNAALIESLVLFMADALVLAVVVTGPSAIAIARATNGATDPVKAACGTIRGDFGNYISRNCVHASDGEDAARREIGLWFPEAPDGADDVGAPPGRLTDWTVLRAFSRWFDLAENSITTADANRITSTVLGNGANAWERDLESEEASFAAKIRYIGHRLMADFGLTKPCIDERLAHLAAALHVLRESTDAAAFLYLDTLEEAAGRYDRPQDELTALRLERDTLRARRGLEATRDALFYRADAVRFKGSVDPAPAAWLNFSETSWDTELDLIPF
jgi:nucleoside-diphosphate kinase